MTDCLSDRLSDGLSDGLTTVLQARSQEARENWEAALSSKDRAIAQLEEALESRERATAELVASHHSSALQRVGSPH